MLLHKFSSGKGSAVPPLPRLLLFGNGFCEVSSLPPSFSLCKGCKLGIKMIPYRTPVLRGRAHSTQHSTAEHSSAQPSTVGASSCVAAASFFFLCEGCKVGITNDTSFRIPYTSPPLAAPAVQPSPAQCSPARSPAQPRTQPPLLLLLHKFSGKQGSACGYAALAAGGIGFVKTAAASRPSPVKGCKHGITKGKLPYAIQCSAATPTGQHNTVQHNPAQPSAAHSGGEEYE